MAKRARGSRSEAYRSVVDQPLPSKVLALLGADETAPSNVVSLPAQRERRETTLPLACRRGDGWRLEAVTFVRRVQRSADGVYRPVSQAAAPIDAAIDPLLSGDVLGSDEELVLIERGWNEQH